MTGPAYAPDDAPEDRPDEDVPVAQSTPALDELAARLAEAREWAAYWKDTAESVKAEIEGQLRPGPRGVRLERKGTPVLTYTRYYRSTFDSPRFRQQFPDLYRQYSKSTAASRLVVHGE